MKGHPVDDETTPPAQGESRRGTLAKMGAVAAGVWVAPAVFSTPAGAQSSVEGPCNCTSVYLSAVSTVDQIVLSQTAALLDWVGPFQNITPSGRGFLVPNSGAYRVTFGFFGAGNMLLHLAINGFAEPTTGTGSQSGGWCERTVLVGANAGDVLAIWNDQIPDWPLTAPNGVGGNGGVSASITIEQVS